MYMLNLAVFITCNDTYLKLAIISLKCFLLKNPDYKPFIIGTYFTIESYKIASKYNITLLNIDLSSDFHSRAEDAVYPIECFYHFYAYNLLSDFDYIVNIEPDIYSNKKIDVNFENIKYISGSYFPSGFIHSFFPIINDLKKIKSMYPDKKVYINQHRILGGFRIYNTKGLKEIEFYEKIVELYQNSLKNGCPRAGDDSLMVLYQLLNKEHIYLLKPEYHIIFYNNVLKEKDIYHFHFTACNEKYWKTSLKSFDGLEYVFRCKVLSFVKENNLTCLLP